jgi:Histone methylation protein DOT1
MRELEDAIAHARASPSPTTFRLAYELACELAVDTTARELAAAALAATTTEPPGELLAPLDECCEWALAIWHGDRSPERTSLIEAWLARARSIVDALSTSELALPELLAASTLLHATCVDIGTHHDSCHAIWSSYTRSVEAHPTTRRALLLADRVRAERLRYRELAHHAAVLAAREQVPAETILATVLGVVPLPLTPSDVAEERSGRNGYAHSSLDAALWAIARLDLQPSDTFYDLGAGLGLPAIVAALNAGARCLGIEFHEHLVARATRNARRLGLDHVCFQTADVRGFDLRGGTKFYLFNPFTPPIMAAIVAQLADVARDHPIRVACVHTTLPGFRLIAATDRIRIYDAP